MFGGVGSILHTTVELMGHRTGTKFLHVPYAVPDVKSKLEAMGGGPRATTSDEMKALVSRQYDTWKRLAVEAHLSID